ncbi:MAG TPA: hypothetical protein VFN91_17740 [Myxococcaceae bacterium]|nr:hypothetical protein [Myxococcaceae bacterium]
MAEETSELRSRIHHGMAVLAMDGDVLGHVYDVGEHALAVERGAFFPREWRASFTEVARVDEAGVWLRHGWGSLVRVSDTFCGPSEAYRAAAEASPMYRPTVFSPPAVSQGEPGLPDPAPGTGDKKPSDR